MKVPLWRRKQKDELDEELRAHHNAAVQDRIERGASPADAEAEIDLHLALDGAGQRDGLAARTLLDGHHADPAHLDLGRLLLAVASEESPQNQETDPTSSPVAHAPRTLRSLVERVPAQHGSTMTPLGSGMCCSAAKRPARCFVEPTPGLPDTPHARASRSMPPPVAPLRQSIASRMIGQVMQCPPPRPRPSSAPAIVMTSIPCLRSSVLV